MVGRAKDVDASFFAAQPLFLKPCSRSTYLVFVREHFPELESLYRFRFENRNFVTSDYRRRMEAMVEIVTRKYGIPRRTTDALLTRGIEDGENRLFTDSASTGFDKQPFALARAPTDSTYPRFGRNQCQSSG